MLSDIQKSSAVIFSIVMIAISAILAAIAGAITLSPNVSAKSWSGSLTFVSGNQVSLIGILRGRGNLLEPIVVAKETVETIEESEFVDRLLLRTQLQAATANQSRALIRSTLRATRLAPSKQEKVRIDLSAADPRDLSSAMDVVGRMLIADSEQRVKERLALVNVLNDSLELDAAGTSSDFENPAGPAPTRPAAVPSAEIPTPNERFLLMRSYSHPSYVTDLEVSGPRSVLGTAATLTAGLMALLGLALMSLAGFGIASRIFGQRGDHSLA